MEKFAIPDEVIAKLKLEHKNLRKVVVKDGAVVFRGPTPQEWDQFQEEFGDKELRGAATKRLVLNCRAWPEEAEFLKMLERKPALVQIFGNHVAEQAGLVKEIEVKDL
jgi:hypothetical protein